MITGKDVRKEIRDGRVVIDDDKATVVDKIKVIFKLVEVGIKVALGNRLNLVKIMEKLEIEKVTPRKPREGDKPTVKEEEKTEG